MKLAARAFMKSRRNELNATKTIAVVAVKKNGETYKMTPIDFKFNAFLPTQMDRAIERKATLESLNPTKTYKIVEIDG